MQINKVFGDRVFLTDVTPYKEEKHSALEIIQYTGALMRAKVAYVGVDCKHTSVGEEVIIQEPIGMDMSFEGVKYKVIRQADILFSF